MDFVGIILLFLGFALFGFMVYLIVTFIPMPDIFKQVIPVAAAVVIILYLLMLVTGTVELPHLGGALRR